MGQQNSRMYVDHMYRTTGKWANWDPEDRVEVGDYGVVEHSSGFFQKQGNVYRERLVTEEPKITKSDALTSYHACSNSVDVKDVYLAGEGSALGAGEAAFKAKFRFSDQGGAVLFMHKPILSSIPPEHLQILGQMPALEKKSIVTETYACPAYFMCLSSKKNPVDVELKLTAAVPVAPGGTAGAGLKWEITVHSGLTQKATTPEGKYGYVPLFRLNKRSFKRDSPEPEYMKDILWVDQPVPWRALDEDGVEFVDVVSDDED
ncbi:hypothetical protein FA95DRAFT_1558442 [Auriscalpium vulgare]|uniref:Uncharacterized protein n=1 Tax=Auriscalpium vulgare TaxID=40419 RepID=A0ACB8RUY5_9AGAM|nr:hypothetical protein FA95DRAFT_1558442 [Auriscalpium vulgare]